jgi:tRNA (cmo5U34)-methyltransferase
MLTASPAAAAKFDPDRAGEYEKQSRIGLAGYDAYHELSACMLAAALGAGTTASILVVGAGGTAQEIITAGKLESNWRVTAVDPSRPMLDLTIQRLTAAGPAGRTDVRLGYVDDLPGDEQFDAATLIGVLHHLPGEEAKENTDPTDQCLAGAYGRARHCGCARA